MFSSVESKTKTRLILFAVFLFGIVGGVGLMNLITARSASNNAGRRLSPMEALDKEVGLTESQRPQVDAVLQQHRQKFKEIINSVQPQLDSLKQDSRLRIRTILTSEQQGRFDEWNKRKDAEREKEKRESSHTR